MSVWEFVHAVGLDPRSIQNRPDGYPPIIKCGQASYMRTADVKRYFEHLSAAAGKWLGGPK